MGELDSVQVHVRAVGVDLLAGEQRADRDDGLLEQAELRLGLGPDLAHPVGHAVPEAGQEPPRMGTGERGDLHRREGGVAHRRGQDAEADLDTGCGRQRSGGGRDAAGEEAVLPQPQLVEPRRLDPARERRQRFRRMLGPHDEAEGRHRISACG